MHVSGQTEEKLIWLNFQAGDQQAYSWLYDTHFAPLYHFGVKMTGDASLVQDCIQELFIKLWRTRENLGQPVSTRTYLIAALKRSILKELAKKQYKTRAELPEDYHFEVTLPHELRLIDLQVTEEKMQQLERALQKLTRRQRDAIHLKFYGQLSYEEIAEIMALNIRSVYNLISKALETLYQEINQYDSLPALPVLLGLLTLPFA